MSAADPAQAVDGGGAVVSGTQGYGENAAALAEQYESIAFADVHRDVEHLIPATPSRIADIGAGSGRDAAALARMGHQVVAAEPTPELRREGQRRHALPNLEWVDDALPELAGLQGREFDVIMLTAVWMHLDEHERARGMAALAALLAPGGQILMSLRHGPVPPGRRMFDVSAEETIALAAGHGLSAHHLVRREDMLDRADVNWSFLGLKRG
ncbi:class I SAM-dependent methyltransferase [Achromobacter xylosoxidans]|uniref:class I SAM-dependent methyltransferase n=1 Tax=Alcaligenes xylosoxydans xylosoxydans TaxID=85698 RepID=UPI0006BF1042|nr:methyltransferase domain-containing protein [Achromobacter xylosoxidans]MDH0524322.1 class I SAM-dependent methyltransferase [Achromobacter xylosoxidans]MDH0547019.1 class I SAM-dependent methyltransferase [Achromobacter xylosoxidans]CUI36313.1 bifunctional 3-demethylubiquinone-9 3-methyltransferase/ 2-octaprenyl-6-hydroxy phenol methylase [Achromobacter xylosoxidans]